MKSHRLWVLWILALAVVGWHAGTDPDHGKETAIRLQWCLWSLVMLGPVYLARRALMGKARSEEAWQKAMEGSLSAAILWLGMALLTGILAVVLVLPARAAEAPPAAAAKYLPVLADEARTYWPDMHDPATLGAQVEQETCITLHSAKCWNPRTELKTSREYGFGLGQLTVTRSFDNFAAARGLDTSLSRWAWADRYDARRQLRTLVLMDRQAWRGLAMVGDAHQRLAMSYSAYNGGLGGVYKDRRLCAATPPCDPGRWWGNVETHSTKARVAVGGYGQSFFAINRGYVQAVMVTRRVRYVQALT